MNRKEFIKKLDKNNYQGEYSYTEKDIDEALRMSAEELKKQYTLEQLNELCGLCGICNGDAGACSIGHAVHQLDRDNVDIRGEAKYNQYFPEV